MAQEIGVKDHYLDLDVLMDRAVALVPDLTSPACGMAPEGGEWHTAGGFRIHRGVSMSTVHSLAWLVVVGCLSLVAGPAVAGVPTLNDSSETFLKYAGNNEKKATRALLILLTEKGSSGVDPRKPTASSTKQTRLSCGGHPGLIESLLKRGADPNMVLPDWGFTASALTYAAHNNGCTGTEISLLVQHGQAPYPTSAYSQFHNEFNSIYKQVQDGTATADKLVAYVDASAREPGRMRVDIVLRPFKVNKAPIQVPDADREAYEAFRTLYDRGFRPWLKPDERDCSDRTAGGTGLHRSSSCKAYFACDDKWAYAAWYGDNDLVGRMLDETEGWFGVNNPWKIVLAAYHSPEDDRLATLRQFLGARSATRSGYSGMLTSHLLNLAIEDGQGDVGLLALEFASDEDKAAALKVAVGTNSIEWIGRLAGAGGQGDEALSFAIGMRQMDLVSALLESGVDAGALSFAKVASLNPFDDEARAILQQMLNNGGDINAYHSDPHRPVDSYVGAVEDRGIEHVIEEVLTMTRAGTALHLVGGNDGMKALLELGADPNLRDFAQRTVLTMVLQRRARAVAQGWPVDGLDATAALLAEFGAKETPPAEIQAWRSRAAAQLQHEFDNHVELKELKETREAEEQRREEEERLAKERRAEEERQARAQQQAEWAQQNAANSVDVMGVIEGVFSEQLQSAPTYQPVVVSPGTSSTPSSSTPSSSTPSSSSSSTSTASPTVRPEDCMVFPKTDHCNDQLDLEDDACRSQHPKDGTPASSSRYASCFTQATERHSACVRQAEADARARLPPECTSRPGASGAASTTEQ